MPLILPTEGNVESHKLLANSGEKGNTQQQHRVDKGKHTRVKLERSELFDCVYICCRIDTPLNENFQRRLFTLAAATTVISLHVSTTPFTLLRWTMTALELTKIRQMTMTLLSLLSELPTNFRSLWQSR
jgi:hypothetical protein